MTAHDFPLAAYAACCVGTNIGFALVWWFAKRRDNWSVVDAAWSLATPLFALPVLLVAPSARTAVIVALLLLWGGRLSLHLHRRVGGGREREDARYSELRSTHGAGTPRFMFRFFQMQACTVWVLLLPVFAAAGDKASYPQIYDIVGALVVLGAVAGESLADAQLRRFKADPANRGRLCEAGLWAYSRHPNYFFEWLVWVGFALAACGAPAGLVAVVAPAMMYWLLRCVTGVPMSEERALRLKGDAWRDYSRRVSVFFPRFPKR